MSFADLKILQRQERELIAELEDLKSKRDNLNLQILGMNKKLQDVSQKIRNLNQCEITVTDHAILRFAERVMGLDSKHIQKIILNEKFKKLVSSFGGSGTFPVNEHCKAVVRNNVIVTIEEN